MFLTVFMFHVVKKSNPPFTVVLNGAQVGGSPNLNLNSILMVLVHLDVHKIVTFHYFDPIQPSRGSTVRLPIRLTNSCQWSLDNNIYLFLDFRRVHFSVNNEHTICGITLDNLTCPPKDGERKMQKRNNINE